jgi:hypothetical protein
LRLTTVAVPVLQRLIVGALFAATLLDEPHKPSTGGGGLGDDVPELARDGGEVCLEGGIVVENGLNSLAPETETSTSIIEFPGTLLFAPDTISEKKSLP